MTYYERLIKKLLTKEEYNSIMKKRKNQNDCDLSAVRRREMEDILLDQNTAYDDTKTTRPGPGDRRGAAGL